MSEEEFEPVQINDCRIDVVAEECLESGSEIALGDALRVDLLKKAQYLRFQICQIPVVCSEALGQCNCHGFQASCITQLLWSTFSEYNSCIR